ncbi:MAG: hypothetical protein R6U78_11715 [Bacteroidales bacterium]
MIHWHGAGPDTEFAHIAMSLNTDEGGAVWSGPVTDEEYNTGNFVWKTPNLGNESYTSPS